MEVLDLMFEDDGRNSLLVGEEAAARKVRAAERARAVKIERVDEDIFLAYLHPLGGSAWLFREWWGGWSIAGQVNKRGGWFRAEFVSERCG